MKAKVVCVGLAKSYLIGLIQHYGAQEILENYRGSNDDAIAAVRADPRKVFTPGCDHQGGDGRCLGHETELPTIA